MRLRINEFDGRDSPLHSLARAPGMIIDVAAIAFSLGPRIHEHISRRLRRQAPSPVQSPISIQPAICFDRVMAHWPR
jgi:hypothetical protein